MNCPISGNNSVGVRWRLFKQYIAGSKPGQFGNISLIYLLIFYLFIYLFSYFCYNETLQFSDLIF